jgi:hypothetical protein
VAGILLVAGRPAGDHSDEHTYPSPLLIANGRVVLLETTEPFLDQTLALGSGDAARPGRVPVGQGTPLLARRGDLGFIRRVDELDAYPPGEAPDRRSRG